MRGLTSTTLHSVCLGVISMAPLQCQRLVCATRFHSTIMCLSAYRRLSGPTRWVGVVFWSPRGSGAASHSPRVKSEYSENRAFWSAREDLRALFCMLEFGREVTGVWEVVEGGGGGGGGPCLRGPLKTRQNTILKAGAQEPLAAPLHLHACTHKHIKSNIRNDVPDKSH